MITEAKSPVRWGILSTANIATKVARAIHLAQNADLIAVASRTEERATAWGQKHNVATTYGTYDELLADDSLDAIYIPYPPHSTLNGRSKPLNTANTFSVKNRSRQTLTRLS